MFSTLTAVWSYSPSTKSDAFKDSSLLSVMSVQQNVENTAEEKKQNLFYSLHCGVACFIHPAFYFPY